MTIAIPWRKNGAAVLAGEAVAAIALTETMAGKIVDALKLREAYRQQAERMRDFTVAIFKALDLGASATYADVLEAARQLRERVESSSAERVRIWVVLDGGVLTGATTIHPSRCGYATPEQLGPEARRQFFRATLDAEPEQ